MKKVLVTGSAGFIGYHLTKRLAVEGYIVTGLDVLTDYYDFILKTSRLGDLGIFDDELIPNSLVQSSTYRNSRFIKADLAEHNLIVDFMTHEKFDFVVNLAAQAGVRYSIQNPLAYTHSNIDGFLSS